MGGSALVGLPPFPAVSVWSGPHARAFVVGPRAERWLFWEVRARGVVPIVGPTLGAYGEFWDAVSGSVTAPESFNSARGGSAGLLVRLAARKVELRLGYGIDEAAVDPSRHRVIVEGLTIAMGLSRP